MENQKTTITFPKDLAFKLKRIALDTSEEEGKVVTVSELVVRAVKDYFKIKKEKSK